MASYTELELRRKHRKTNYWHWNILIWGIVNGRVRTNCVSLVMMLISLLWRTNCIYVVVSPHHSSAVILLSAMFWNIILTWWWIATVLEPLLSELYIHDCRGNCTTYLEFLDLWNVLTLIQRVYLWCQRPTLSFQWIQYISITFYSETDHLNHYKTNWIYYLFTSKFQQ